MVIDYYRLMNLLGDGLYNRTEKEKKMYGKLLSWFQVDNDLRLDKLIDTRVGE